MRLQTFFSAGSHPVAACQYKRPSVSHTWDRWEKGEIPHYEHLQPWRDSRFLLL